MWLIVVPWILYPFPALQLAGASRNKDSAASVIHCFGSGFMRLSTYAMCRRVPQSAKNCWLWTWAAASVPKGYRV